MAAKQNITLSMDKELLRQARAMAAGQGLSVSSLLAEGLRQMTDKSARYQHAMAKALALLDTGFHLGGTGAEDRESLHDRAGLR